jgi:hypothetical protein
MEKIVQKEEFIIRGAEAQILGRIGHCEMYAGIYTRVFAEGKVTWLAPNGKFVDSLGVSYLEAELNG